MDLRIAWTVPTVPTDRTARRRARLRHPSAHLRRPMPERACDAAVGSTCTRSAGETTRPPSVEAVPNRRSHPVEGGCANDYVYVFGDPINSQDLSGEHASCNNTAVYGPAGMITVHWIPGIKRYEFNVQLFPPFSEIGTRAFFEMKMTHYGPGGQKPDTETFKKSEGAGYGFHGRFDNRYGKMGSKRYSSGETVKLQLHVRIYDPRANVIAEVFGTLRCTV